MTPRGNDTVGTPPEGPGTVDFDGASLSRERIAHIARHALVVFEISIVFAIFHVFDIERSSGILRLTTLIVGAFIVNSVLPPRFRLPFFVVTSFAAFWVILGWVAVPVFAAGLLVIGLCHLPIPFVFRVTAIASVGGLLAIVELRVVPGLSPAILARGLPVLASLLMFRTIVYLYELRHERGSISPWMRISYFFLLPNACFTLFPVVDFQALRRTYYDRPTLEIYQRGVRLIFRGLTHLLVYRFVYYRMSPIPLTVDGVRSVMLFLVSSWLLFLHVSGVFHVIVGILCLFGFNLPDANRLYFLADSPNEIWRRANIYWKDFMVKVFYLPAYKAMQKRKLSMKRSLIAATVFVFVATWLLHTYQWFWLLGRFSLSAFDAAFWTIFAVLVILNTVAEMRRTHQPKSLHSDSWSLGRASQYVLRVMATFTLMSLMWSWWNTRDTREWLFILSTARDSRPPAFVLVGLIVAAVFVFGIVANYFANRGWTMGIGARSVSFWRSVATTLTGAFILLGASSALVKSHIGRAPALFVESMQHEHLNQRDALVDARSYYEAMMTTDQMSSSFSLNHAVDNEEPISSTSIVRRTNDALIYEFLPSRKIMNRGVMVETNTWGMRDKEYALQKPAGAYRIALLGGSVSMGSGVPQNQVFEGLLEDQLNSVRPSAKFSSYEILNFSMGGHGVVQYAEMGERKAVTFHPDAMMVVTLGAESERTKDQLVALVMKGTPLPPGLGDIIKRAGLKGRHTVYETMRALDTPPVPDEIRRWGYQRIADVSRQHGIIPIWAYLPSASGQEDPAQFEKMAADAKSAGMVILDNREAYARATHDTVYRLGDMDHPNVKGHRLLAAMLYSQIVKHADQLGLSPLVQAQH